MGLKDLFVMSKGKGEESVGFTQQGFEDWVQSLPLLDLPRCLLMLDAALFRLTMSAYRDESWYNLLTLLFEPIGAVSRLVCKKYQGDTTTSKESQRALMFFVRKLHLQFGDSCYHMLVDDSNALSNIQKTQAAFYTMQSYSLVILRSYQLSMLIPKNIWLNFYDVYHRLAAEPVDELVTKLNGCNATYESISPLSPFSSSVIISVLSPYKLNVDLLENIYTTLNETIDNTIFYEGGTETAEEECCFSFHLDRSPSMYQFYPDDRASLVFIDQKLILSRLKSVVEDGFKVNKILLDSLASIETRKSERFKLEGQVQIILGIANSYRLLYGQFEHLYDGQDSEHGMFVYPENSSKNWQVIINAYKKMIFPTAPSECDEEFMRWEVIDKSEHGVGVVSQESYPSSELEVGNFVQLNTGSSSSWFSGLVRWMNVKEGGHISLGLEYLARENIPVYLQTNKQRAQGYKSIAILGKYTFKPWPSIVLITQGLSYPVGQEVILISDQHHIAITLQSCLVHNKNCKIFSFKAKV